VLQYVKNITQRWGTSHSAELGEMSLDETELSKMRLEKTRQWNETRLNEIIENVCW